MHIMVSLACHADSSTMLGWMEWVEKGDQFPYIKMCFLFQFPKAVREVIQRCGGELSGRCRSSGKHCSFQMGWEVCRPFAWQWVRYCLKAGSLSCAPGLCFMPWPRVTHRKLLFAALVVKYNSAVLFEL